MKRLTDPGYWDGVHKSAGGGTPAKAGLARRIFGAGIHDRTLCYAEHLVWDVYYPRILGDGRGRSAIEVGSAPGHHLVGLHRRFGFDVHGVELSDDGVVLNRRVFREAGLDEARIMQADFFSDDFQRAHAGRFDVVISRGFIEHFTDMEAVMRAHLSILRTGGVLVISMPNLKGLNLGMAGFFHKETIPLHNLSIMSPEAFGKLFDGRGLVTSFCGLYGIFDFGLFNAGLPGRRRLLNACRILQRALNLLFRLVARPGWLEGRWHSPYFLFIGRKA